MVPVAGLASPPVSVHHLLTGWQLSSWAADLALAGQVAAGLAYLAGVRRLAGRGRRWPLARTGAFLGGLVVLTVAVVSGVASYDEDVFSVHVVQHLLLMMVAPPLLALGAPVTLALQASPRNVQSGLARLLHHPAALVLTTPMLAAGVYYASMYADLSTSFYPYSLDHPLVHAGGHVVMFWLGCLFWWPIVAADGLPRRPGPALRLGALLVGMPFEAFLGISLLGANHPLAARHTLSDTRTGGGLFWVLAMMVTFVAALVVAAQWMRQEERRSSRPAGRQEQAREAAWAAEWARRTGQVPPTVDPRAPGAVREAGIRIGSGDGSGSPRG